MPDILLPVAVSQGRIANPLQKSTESTAAGGSATDGGFGELLAALGLELSEAGEAGLEQLAAALPNEQADLPARLAAMLQNAGNDESPGQAIDMEDFQALLEDLRAFLEGQGPTTSEPGPAVAGFVGSETEVELDMVSLPIADSNASPGTLDTEEAAETSNGPVPQAVRDAWLAQLPAHLREAVTRLLEGGNALPQAAAAEAGVAEAVVSVQATPLQQLLMLLQPAADKQGQSSAEILKQALAALGQSGEAGAGEDVAGVVSAAKDRMAALRDSAMTSPGVPAEGDAVEPSGQTQLRAAVLNLQQALGQGHQSAWSPPLTSASGVALQAGAPALSNAPPPFSMPQLPAIPTAPGEGAWSQALGERILWMTGRDIQRAELRLTPPHLGPVEIRVSVQNDQASVSFTAQHPFTREALEAALPRLREMLGEANLNLADVDVGQRDAGESRGNRWGEPSRGSFGTDGFAQGDGQGEPVPALVGRLSQGLVDDFA